MRALLTVKMQNEFINTNYSITGVEHKWSCRGYGNSKILDRRGNVLAKATGCGYDRFGSVIGGFIEATFNDELNKLAKRFCKQGARNATRKGSSVFYGMFYNAKTKKAYVDGACGSDCMIKILNAIGFDFHFVNETNIKAQTGSSFYELLPLSPRSNKYVLRGI